MRSEKEQTPMENACATTVCPAGERAVWLDNLRCGIVLLVVVYHVVYLFNSTGTVSTVNVHGIPAMDALLYFVYPWFMALLFVLAGIGARLSLKHRTTAQFCQERVRRLLIPAVGAFFLTDWLSSWVLRQYVDVFGGAGNTLAFPAKALICCLCGIGPMWFVHVLLIASLVLLVIRAVDRSDRLWLLGGRFAHPAALLALALPIWGASQIGNLAMISVYRFGIYILCFLLGYAVFSHREVLAVLQKMSLPAAAVSVVFGVWYTWYEWGKNYADLSVLRTLPTCLYTWLMILAAIGCAQRWWNRETGFTRFLRPRSFSIFVLHYPVVSLYAWLLATRLALPMAAVYPLVLVLTLGTVALLHEIISRIPGLRFWLLGIRKKVQH